MTSDIYFISDVNAFPKTMAANEKLTIQALKDHDKVHPKFKASVGQPTNREVTKET